jgi:small subunit ribosomal protein S16
MFLSVRIRLQRHGRKKLPFYRVVVADSRSSRDGRFIEKVGYYNPITEPADISINEERALYWLKVGAKPSDTAKSLLKKTGVWQKFKAPEQVSAPEEVSEVETDDKSETELDQEEPKQNEVE